MIELPQEVKVLLSDLSVGISKAIEVTKEILNPTYRQNKLLMANARERWCHLDPNSDLNIGNMSEVGLFIARDNRNQLSIVEYDEHLACFVTKRGKPFDVVTSWCHVPFDDQDFTPYVPYKMPVSETGTFLAFLESERYMVLRYNYAYRQFEFLKSKNGNPSYISERVLAYMPL